MRLHGSTLARRHPAFRARGLKLDSSRDNPSPEQLDLSNALLTLPGPDGFRSAEGVDGRNYPGDMRGLPEARANRVGGCRLWDGKH